MDLYINKDDVVNKTETLHANHSGITSLTICHVRAPNLVLPKLLNIKSLRITHSNIYEEIPTLTKCKNVYISCIENNIVFKGLPKCKNLIIYEIPPNYSVYVPEIINIEYIRVSLKSVTRVIWRNLKIREKITCAATKIALKGEKEYVQLRDL